MTTQSPGNKSIGVRCVNILWLTVVDLVFRCRLNRMPLLTIEGRKYFNLTTHSTHFILYGVTHMVKDHSDNEKESRCRHIGYSFRLTARVLLYASSHRQDSTYHGLCYTSRGALAGTRNSSMDPPNEGSIRRPIAPLANALTTEIHIAPG